MRQPAPFSLFLLNMEEANFGIFENSLKKIIITKIDVTLIFFNFDIRKIRRFVLSKKPF